MKSILILLTISSLSLNIHASTYAQKCQTTRDTNGKTTLVCTDDTSKPLSTLKSQSNAMAGANTSKLQRGKTTGEFQTNVTNCDSKGNCTVVGTESLSFEKSFGTNDVDGNVDPSKGLEAKMQVNNTLPFRCSTDKTHVLGSGVAVHIHNCAIDSDKNVKSFEAAICREVLQEGGCNFDEPTNPTDWTNSVKFEKSSMLFVQNNTKSFDGDATATANCRSQSQACTLDFTMNITIGGSLEELAQMAADKDNDDANFLSGNRMAARQQDDPSWDAQFQSGGTGSDMIDCAQNNLIGSADAGFLLSCDGSQRVDMNTDTCEEVAQCVQESTTLITHLSACEVFVPIDAEVCHVTMPYGACDVFLEHHEQVCDTIVPNGTCVYELESVIQTCDVHIPNGSCNEELVMDDMACVYSVPEGSCNVELVDSVVGCTNTIPQGNCNIELDEFTKTCQEDVSVLKECLLTAETAESNCTAHARYTIHECKERREVAEHKCNDQWEATVSTTPCSMGYNTAFAENGQKCRGEVAFVHYHATCSGLRVEYEWWEMCSASDEHGADDFAIERDTKTLDWIEMMNNSTSTTIEFEGIYIRPVFAEINCNYNSCTARLGLGSSMHQSRTLTISRNTIGGNDVSLTRSNSCTALENATK